MTHTRAEQAVQIARQLTEDCTHGLNFPKVDCPECCEGVFVKALLTLQQETVEACAKVAEGCIEESQQEWTCNYCSTLIARRIRATLEGTGG
jgi:hypothetical protein